MDPVTLATTLCRRLIAATVLLLVLYFGSKVSEKVYFREKHLVIVSSAI